MTGFMLSYILNYKALPYKTEWVEYPDIEALCKKFGVPPTGKTPDNARDYYTVPLIYDPSTSKHVVDSLDIGKYLDEAYPDTPKLFPPGLNAFQLSFNSGFLYTYMIPVFMIIISRTCASLNPRSNEYFRRTREAVFGKLEDLNTPEQWDKVESAWGQLKSFFLENGKGKDTLFAGDTITYSDIQIASVLIWARTVCGADSEDWKRMAAMHDGFWGKFLAQFEKYENVDA